MFWRLLLILFVLLSSSQAEETLVISSGVKGQGYYNLATSIEKILKEHNFSYALQNRVSLGSAQNLQRLANGEVELAIVQSDTAFYAENGIYTFKENPLENLRTIINFYQEPLFIITNQAGVNNIYQLANMRINIGLRDSGVESTSQVLFKSIGIWESISKYHYGPNRAIKALLQKRVQAILLNFIDDTLKEKILAKELYIIPIQKEFIEQLKRTFSYFSLYEYRIDGEIVPTVAVTTLLVTRSDVESEVIYRLTKILDANYNKLHFPKGFAKPKEHFFQNPLEYWHKGTLKYLQEQGINYDQKIHLDLYILYLFFAIVILVLLLILLGMFILSHTDLVHRFHGTHTIIKWLQSIYLVLTKYKYITLFVLIVLLNIVFAILIKYFEHNWALEHGEVAIFDTLSLFKILWWLFIFGSSNYDGGIFPHSNGGEFIASLSPMLEFGSLITLLGLIAYDKIIKHFMEANGMGVQRIKDHIILCGWSDNAHFIVKNLLHENKLYKRQIVILAEAQYEEQIKRQKFDPMYLFYVKGDATVREDLDRANIKEADIAIVISDSKMPEPDAKNILKVLTIEKYCLELERSGKRKGRSNIHTIAEIENPKNIPIAEDAGVDQIVSLGNIESKIFTQAVLNPGVAKFINEIVTYNDQNDIYSFPVSKESQLYNKTYDEILSILREHKILLLSINVEYKRTKAQAEEIMQKYRLKGPVITNPYYEAAKMYRVQEGDLLIVLAQYEKDVLAALKKLGG